MSSLEATDEAASGSIGGYAGHGVWVPHGMTAEEIMRGAEALERKYDVAPFTSRAMVRAVLAAIREGDAPAD